MPDPRLEAAIDQAFQKQQELATALDRHLKGIRGLKHVVDIGIGYQRQRGRRSQHIGPIVFVDKKVPKGKLSSAQLIPRTLVYRGRKYRIDVVELGKITKTCSTGIADSQHNEFDKTPPGVAICGVDQNGQIPKGRQGSSGAILEIVQVPPITARYLLTCDHVVTSPQNWAQPWDPSKIKGTWIRTATVPEYDASVLEIRIPNYSLDVHCLNTKQKPPIKPLVGMRVMKSGAGTGVTGSYISGTSADGSNIYIDNDPVVPKSDPGLVYNFDAHGDSGSVAWLGTPPDPRDPSIDPFELGPVVGKLVAPIVDLEPTLQAKIAKREQLMKDYRGRAIALLVGVHDSPAPAGIGFQGTLPARYCKGISMIKILENFSMVLGKPVIVADS